MKMRSTEKVLLGITVLLILFTAMTALYQRREVSQADEEKTDNSFNFLAPTELATNESANYRPDKQTWESSKVVASTARKKESDLERIKRIIGPQEPGDCNENYMIRVFKDRQYVTVFSDPEADGSFSQLLKVFPCSSGLGKYETSSGSFQIGVKHPSGYMFDGSYGQYCSEFLKSHYFHAVPSYGGVEESGVSWQDFNQLGSKASHGCIRLMTKDAKWIYDYCVAGTPVEILDSSEDYPQLPAFVDTIKMSEGGPSWDPTNPNPANPYQQDPSILLPYNKQ